MVVKKKKSKKLISMARTALVQEGNHGGGKADPTKQKPAGPGTKIYQMG